MFLVPNNTTHSYYLSSEAQSLSRSQSWIQFLHLKVVKIGNDDKVLVTWENCTCIMLHATDTSRWKWKALLNKGKSLWRKPVVEEMNYYRQVWDESNIQLLCLKLNSKSNWHSLSRALVLQRNAEVLRDEMIQSTKHLVGVSQSSRKPLPEPSHKISSQVRLNFRSIFYRKLKTNHTDSCSKIPLYCADPITQLIR